MCCRAGCPSKYKRVARRLSYRRDTRVWAAFPGSPSWRSEDQHEWLTSELPGTSALTWRSAGLTRQPRQQLGHPWRRIGGHCVHSGPVPCHGGGPPAQRSVLVGLCGPGEPDQRVFLQLANALAAYIQLAGERIVSSRLRREGAGGEDHLAPLIGFA